VAEPDLKRRSVNAQAALGGDVAFSFVDIRGVRCTKDKDPGVCPLCHRAIHADEIAWTLVPNSRATSPILEIVFCCPHEECGRYFIGRYRLSTRTGYSGTGVGEFHLWATTPFNPAQPDTPKEVQEVSPGYAEILQQAAAAEAFKLDQVAGPGYRKALEFLLKDYCATNSKARREEILAMPLGRVIAELVDDPNVKACGSRATWLGNDETHYVRRWEGKDIDDLKVLLRLTANWIHNHVLTRRYLDEMPSGKDAV
jgi:hypothetical protein